MKSETPEQALLSLEGLLRGVWMDDEVNDEEVQLLIDWTKEHQDFSNTPPFDVLIPELEKVLDDNVFEHGELDELFWLIEGYKMSSDSLAGPGTNTTKLAGLLRGVVADSVVTLSELKGIQDWLTFNKSADDMTPEFQEIVKTLDEATMGRDVSEEKLNHLLQVFRGVLAKIDSQN